MSPGSEIVFGIYGYEFHLPASICGVQLVPLCSSSAARIKAADRTSFQLTGFGRLLAPSADEWDDAARIDLLGAAMTFAQQRQVLVTRPIVVSAGDTTDSLFSESRLGAPLHLHFERHSYGQLIATETWSQGSRSAFLTAFVQRFVFETPGDTLRLAFFRQIEIWRLSTPYVELQHFLAFSGLEMLARASGAYEQQRNAAVPISQFLTSIGLPVSQPEVEVWTEARNNAFHLGLLAAPARNGVGVVRLADQLYPLTVVFADALLKSLGFDDGHINWNRWRDRMHFQ